MRPDPRARKHAFRLGEEPSWFLEEVNANEIPIELLQYPVLAPVPELPTQLSMEELLPWQRTSAWVKSVRRWGWRTVTLHSNRRKRQNSLSRSAQKRLDGHKVATCPDRGEAPEQAGRPT